MSIEYFPFESGDGATVNEAQWRSLASLWRSTGVIYESTDTLLAYGDSSGLNVKVKAGSAYIEGFYFSSSAEETLVITTPDVTNPRYDRVVITVDWTLSDNNIYFEVLAGTPAGSPTVPALTQTASKYQLSLATVYVEHAVVTIASTDVVTDRIWSESPTGGADVLTVQVFS